MSGLCVWGSRRLPGQGRWLPAQGLEGEDGGPRRAREGPPLAGSSPAPRPEARREREARPRGWTGERRVAPPRPRRPGSGRGAGRRRPQPFPGSGPRGGSRRLLPRQVRAARRNAAGLTHQRLLPTCRPPRRRSLPAAARPPAARPPRPGSPARRIWAAERSPARGGCESAPKVGPAIPRTPPAPPGPRAAEVGRAPRRFPREKRKGVRTPAPGSPTGADGGPAAFVPQLFLS